jgi:hypothetical protein
MVETGLPAGITDKPIPKSVNYFFKKIIFFLKNQIHRTVYRKPVKSVCIGFSSFHKNRPVFQSMPLERASFVYVSSHASTPPLFCLASSCVSHRVLLLYVLFASSPVFKNWTEWKKSEVAESDFCTNFFMNNTNFFGEQYRFFNEQC